MRYDIVLFDLDGTLFDTSEGLFYYTAKIVEEYGLGKPDEATLKKTIGPFLGDSFRHLFGAKEEDVTPMVVEFYRRYNKDGYKMSKMYPGILSMLKNLKDNGIQIGVTTLKQQQAARQMICDFGLAPYVQVVYGASDDDSVSTKADTIRLALKALKPTPQQKVVLVGDSFNDAVGAKATGLDFIAVTYGFDFTCAEDANKYTPVFCAANAKEVESYLLEK